MAGVRKRAFKGIGVGDVLFWDIHDGSRWLGTVLERRVTERLNQETGRWKYVLRLYVRWNEDEGPESWLEERDWKAHSFGFVSSASPDMRW